MKSSENEGKTISLRKILWQCLCDMVKLPWNIFIGIRDIVRESTRDMKQMVRSTVYSEDSWFFLGIAIFFASLIIGNLFGWWVIGIGVVMGKFCSDVSIRICDEKKALKRIARSDREDGENG